MTTTQQIEFFAPQIQLMAIHAEAIGFDVVNGDMMELGRLWIEHTRKSHAFLVENATEVMQTLRSMTI